MTLHSQDRTTITGTIVDSVSRQPIERVTVYLMSGERAVTDSDGRFRLQGVPRASTVLALRRIGYLPQGIPLRALAAAADVEIGTLTMTPAAFRLDSISIQARLITRNPRLAEFYDRRRGGMGHYFTRQQLWDKNPIYLTEVIQTVPGVRCSTQGCTGRRVDLRGACAMQVYVDGIRVENFELDNIPPAWVAGVEVYRGPATTPLVFGMSRRGSGPQCGTIVIWTGGDEQQGL